MDKSRTAVRKYVISSALIAAMAFSPALGEKVSANADSDSIKENTEDSSETVALDRGSRGEEVKDLQTELQDLGYYTYNLDGLFGPITEQAVKDFQADEGLKVDGMAGPNTMEALGGTDEESVALEASDEEASAKGSEIVSIAEELIGTPYVWGGTSPEGFDSSGFIQYVFDQAGIDLSRTERDMWKNDGETVESPEIGDVVFFEGTYDVEGASHSGIYIGNNEIIHAGSDGVEVSDLSYDYWQDHYLGVKSFD